MPIKILIVNRSLKFIGVFIKGFSYIFHFICPKKRFTIPKYSKALKETGYKTKVPKIIWQTNYTNKVSLPVYLNYILNRVVSPTLEYSFIDSCQKRRFNKD